MNLMSSSCTNYIVIIQMKHSKEVGDYDLFNSTQ